MIMYSPPVDVVRYTNGTLVDLTATASSFTSVDYNPETKTGTYQPSAITIFATLSGDISLDGWQYSIDGGENWTNVISGEHGLTVSDTALIVDATTDLFSRNNYVVFKAVADDPTYYDTLAITREVDPTIVYDRTWTNIEQTNDKIALIASEEQLAQFSDSSTLVSKVAEMEQTADGFRQTVETSYATKTYAEGQAATAANGAVATAATDATNKANAAKQEAISAASTDATNKANAAKEDAVEDALSEVGQILDDYVTNESLSSTISQTSNEIMLAVSQEYTVNENLFSMADAYLNKVLNGLGTLTNTSSRSYVSSQHIPVEAGSHYTFQVWTAQATTVLTKYVYYDSSDAFISTYPSGNSVSVYRNTTHVTISLTAPANAAYLAVSFGNEQATGSNCWAKVEKDGPTKYVDANVDSRIENAKYSQLNVSVGQISSTVAEKVGKDEVISSINQTAEQITIKANKINLDGAISGNGNFAIDTEGTMIAKNAVFEEVVYGAYIRGGSLITDTGDSRYIAVDGDKVKANTDNDYLTSIQKSLFVYLLDYGWMDYGDYGGIDLRSKSSCAMNIGSTEVFNVVSNTLDGFTTHVGSGESLPVDEESDFYNRNKKHLNRGSNLYTNFHVYGNTYLKGTLSTTGKKNREVLTKNYGRVTLSAYETPTPMFGDIGTGKTDENGEAYISIDDIFAETTSLKIEYCVFLQKEGQGDLWVDAKEIDHFVAKGTPNLNFSWELKAVQRDYEMVRLEEMADATADDPTNYEDDALQSDMDEELSSLDELDKDMELLVKDYDREVMEMEIRNYENLESVSGNQ